MFWEYLILAAILGWAFYYLWRSFFGKKSCVCGACPSMESHGCPARDAPPHCTEAGTDNTRKDPETLNNRHAVHTDKRRHQTDCNTTPSHTENES